MINLSDYRMTAADGCGVYVGTYRKYSCGSIEGMWIDLEACSDAEEFFDVCREVHKDEADPEFMFQDYQGFPEELYHESMSEEDVEKILEYVQLSEHERELYDDFCECYGDADGKDIDEISERCVGSGYDSISEFLTQQADEMLDGFEACCKHDYSCKGAAGMVSELRRFFDYDAYVSYHESGYSRGSNGNIFYNA